MKYIPFQKRYRHKAWLLSALILSLGQCFAGAASASDGFYSETSHTLFGAVAGGAFTWGANYVVPEHRALVGFAASAAVGVLAELNDKKFSVLDAGAHALGAAFGAAITDEFLLAPVIKRDVGHNSSYIGVILVKQF